jgi:hypothetical protein
VTMTDDPSGRLRREWVLCALAAAAARFVPVPLLDDVIASRATRTAVARTWAAHGRPDDPTVVGILVGDTRGFLHGLAVSLVKLPLLLLLYPIRKLVRLITAVRGVGRDLTGVLLLARAVDRCLRAGFFDAADPEARARQARLVRRAHERTVGNADLRVLEHAIRSTLRQVGGLRRPAREFARDVFGRRVLGRSRAEAAHEVSTGAVDPERGSVPPDVDEDARRIEAVLERPDVTGLLAVLDTRFDEALTALASAEAVDVRKAPRSA